MGWCDHTTNSLYDRCTVTAERQFYSRAPETQFEPGERRSVASTVLHCNGCEIITRTLAVQIDLTTDPPRQRVEDQDGADKELKGVVSMITPLDVGQFMCE
jgi:hypothetical protein